MDENIDKKARQVAFRFQNLMSVVDYDHNRHEKCLACGHKFKQHYPDGLPCENDDDLKQLFKKDRWGNVTIRKNT